MKQAGGLLLLATGLTVAVVLEVVDTPRADLGRLRTPTTAGLPSASSRVADHTGEWVTTVLERPLFSPNRRPAAVAATGVPGLPRLTGILVGPFGRSAIFANEGAKPLVVEEGARVASYTVKSIEASQVRLVGPNGLQVLYPSFAAAATAPGRRPGQAPLPR